VRLVPTGFADRPRADPATLRIASTPVPAGFADRPGDMVDPFHTLFGTAALSLLGDTTLKEINPIFCMPEEVIRRTLGEGTLLTNINPVR